MNRTNAPYHFATKFYHTLYCTAGCSETTTDSTRTTNLPVGHFAHLHHLLSQQGSAPALDEVQVRVHLVGAVDSHVQHYVHASAQQPVAQDETETQQQRQAQRQRQGQGQRQGQVG